MKDALVKTGMVRKLSDEEREKLDDDFKYNQLEFPKRGRRPFVYTATEKGIKKYM